MLNTTIPSIQDVHTCLSFLEKIQNWPSAESKKWVETFFKKDISSYDISAVVIFGSIARNVRYCADVDLLIIYHGKKPKIYPPMDVDVRMYEEGAVEGLIRDGNEVIGWAIRFGILLYEQNFYWSDISRRWKNRLPLPSPVEAEKRAERARLLLEDLEKIGDEDAINEQLTAMLTQIGRANLIRSGIFPASRPELPRQLREIGETKIANKLSKLLSMRKITWTTGSVGLSEAKPTEFVKL